MNSATTESDALRQVPCGLEISLSNEGANAQCGLSPRHDMRPQRNSYLTNIVMRIQRSIMDCASGLEFALSVCRRGQLTSIIQD